MKLTNINDNLSNYIFQASVKLSLVVSSVKVGSRHTLMQGRFCWEIWKKLVCLRAISATQSQIRRSYSSRERSSFEIDLKTWQMEGRELQKQVHTPALPQKMLLI